MLHHHHNNPTIAPPLCSYNFARKLRMRCVFVSVTLGSVFFWCCYALCCCWVCHISSAFFKREGGRRRRGSIALKVWTASVGVASTMVVLTLEHVAADGSLRTEVDDDDIDNEEHDGANIHGHSNNSRHSISLHDLTKTSFYRGDASTSHCISCCQCCVFPCTRPSPSAMNTQYTTKHQRHRIQFLRCLIPSRGAMVKCLLLSIIISFCSALFGAIVLLDVAGTYHPCPSPSPPAGTASGGDGGATPTPSTQSPAATADCGTWLQKKGGVYLFQFLFVLLPAWACAQGCLVRLTFSDPGIVSWPGMAYDTLGSSFERERDLNIISVGLASDSSTSEGVGSAENRSLESRASQSEAAGDATARAARQHSGRGEDVGFTLATIDSPSDKAAPAAHNTRKIVVDVEKESAEDIKLALLDQENSAIVTSPESSDSNSNNGGYRAALPAAVRDADAGTLSLPYSVVFELNDRDELRYLVTRSDLEKRTDTHVSGNRTLPPTLMYVRPCTACKQLKLPRSSHCRACDFCVEDFDHHCGVTGGCVGRRNISFFAYFVWSVAFLCNYVLVATCVEFARTKDEELHSLRSITCVLLIIVAGFNFIPVTYGGLTYVRLYLRNNMTTLREARKGGSMFEGVELEEDWSSRIPRPFGYGSALRNCYHLSL